MTLSPLSLYTPPDTSVCVSHKADSQLVPWLQTVYIFQYVIGEKQTLSTLYLVKLCIHLQYITHTHMKFAHTAVTHALTECVLSYYRQ